MAEEKYSVLMSLYIKEKSEYLRLSIDSMLNQTTKPDEIVLIEDGPLNDELYYTINEYVTSFPKLFKIVTNDKNIGLGYSLNKGLKECRNELVARMDTDDISKPNRCKMQLAAFAANPNLDIVGAYVDEFITTPLNIISTRIVPNMHKDIYNFAKRRSPFNHPVVMYRKSKVLKNGGYSNLRRNQDVDLFGRMLFHGCIAQNIDESLLWFRCSNELAKRRKSWENTKSYIDTIRGFWKMGFASFNDYFFVAIIQMAVFIIPVQLQHWVYKRIIRKQ